MTLDEWIIARLQRPLPATAAHEPFVPEIPDRRSRLQPAPADARNSAVLMPIVFDSSGSVSTVLTVRSEGLRNHRGQISFPGGRSDEGEDAVMTALREAHEEIGLTSDRVHVLGQLSPLYIPPSHSAVTPVVAVVSEPPAWQINSEEVSEVLVVPMSVFRDPRNVLLRNDIIQGLRVDVPHWNVHPTIPLWGATAMMLNELVMIINEYDMECA
ncbi:MAG: NUDIX hydrolase [Bacteroidota bacterium]|jgi:8-oxo-dGTP pyrophosphatase MutT (NUDIX family)